MTLVDTSVWSIVYRRRRPTQSVAEQAALSRWSALVDADAAVLIGPVRQELLTGVRTSQEFDRLRRVIDYFALLRLDAHTFDLAAHFHNECRMAGIAAGDTDMTICAAAAEHSVSILTLDLDFPRYATVLPIALV